ncbi:MAG: hypothetical protein RBG13Loki_4259 [Promethearchaeota archaeon CR_4]|nr:MAG: hypothetical protein RBG13Loki_4259 [Candidatus Lokiarchaeota archaeon CR_4]
MNLQEYSARLAGIPGAVNPREEETILETIPDEWAVVILSLVKGHIARRLPFLTADYLYGKVREAQGPHPESLLDDSNRAIYDHLTHLKHVPAWGNMDNDQVNPK